MYDGENTRMGCSAHNTQPGPGKWRHRQLQSAAPLSQKKIYSIVTCSAEVANAKFANNATGFNAFNLSAWAKKRERQMNALAERARGFVDSAKRRTLQAAAEPLSAVELQAATEPLSATEPQKAAPQAAAEAPAAGNPPATVSQPESIKPELASAEPQLLDLDELENTGVDLQNDKPQSDKNEANTGISPRNRRRNQ